MPDEEGNTQIDEENVPETPLHAREGRIEEDNERPRAEDAEGETVDEDEADADQVTNTGGATSGGPPQEDAGPDPSQA